MEQRRWVVLKFGGTSVASRSGWETIANRCRALREAGAQVLVVCSAMSGVSNQLEALIERAVAGDEASLEIAALHRRHATLSRELEVQLPREVSDAIETLGEGLAGIRMLREASPRVRARLMALGELMSTRIGVAFLRACGLDGGWVDARALLTAIADLDVAEGPRFLSAHVQPRFDPTARRALPSSLVVTQGFIASAEQGDTVLLGRGGSDTSASYLAVTLGAAHVEIWTDVPGLFTANPRQIPSARHLSSLCYDEVAAMAALGARVLHPRCVGPLCDAGIPLHVRSTYLPEAAGTLVDASDPRQGIKAVTGRKGLVLLRMCRPSQWQPVGFVADVSACFKQRGLSIDLMSTSPSTISATIDPASVPRTRLDALLHDLADVCDVTIEQPVASVSLVGTAVRDALDQVGGAMGELEGAAIELVAQGAADHHLTFIVPEEARDPLIERLHRALFDRETALDVGPTLPQLRRDPRLLGPEAHA